MVVVVVEPELALAALEPVLLVVVGDVVEVVGADVEVVRVLSCFVEALASWPITPTKPTTPSVAARPEPTVR